MSVADRPMLFIDLLTNGRTMFFVKEKLFLTAEGKIKTANELTGGEMTDLDTINEVREILIEQLRLEGDK